ncbi:MAG: hypothetical protein PHF00_11880, partial [Elusimicrobia bacterium]|nr:hypothetical protein [Elusimicrobiota bacterium]
QKMKSLRKEAVLHILAHDRGCGLLEYVPNPMMLYFAVRLKRLDPRVMFSGAREAFKAFYDGLGDFLRLERFLDILSSDAAFGDFSHPPRHTTDQELCCLRLNLTDAPGPAACACSKGLVGFPGLAELREAADLLLHSPGAAKRIIFHPYSVDRDFELMGALSLYAMLKAGKLAKRLEILIISGPQTVSAENLRFLEAHAIAYFQETASVQDLERLESALSRRRLDDIATRLRGKPTERRENPLRRGLCSDRHGNWYLAPFSLSVRGYESRRVPAGDWRRGLVPAPEGAVDPPTARAWLRLRLRQALLETPSGGRACRAGLARGRASALFSGGA